MRALRAPKAHEARRRTAVAALAAATLLLAAGCTGGDDPEPTQAPGATETEPETEQEPDVGTAEETVPEDDPAAGIPDVPTVTVEDVAVVATGLPAPWGLAVLPDGDLLVTLRDEARLVVVDPGSGDLSEVTGPGAQELAADTAVGGEGGLLGLAMSPDFAEDSLVYVYRTGAAGNAVLRGALDGTTLGALETVIDAIPAASNHNGGAVAFGPDGQLYVGTGDAADAASAQDVDSLAGKILRLAPSGEPAEGNPVPGDPVWSLGHRNVQGFGWDVEERMFASEFGASDVDELNLIVPGGNYGWPLVEGEGGADDGFVDPLVTWPTAQASPSGLAVTAEGVYLAALRGERLWRVPLAQAVGGEDIAPQELFVEEYGRLRTVLALPDGDLLVVTNNTDGRGTPGEDDDQILRVTLS